jgi:hypothetical protein
MFGWRRIRIKGAQAVSVSAASLPAGEFQFLPGSTRYLAARIEGLVGLQRLLTFRACARARSVFRGAWRPLPSRAAKGERLCMDSVPRLAGDLWLAPHDSARPGVDSLPLAPDFNAVVMFGAAMREYLKLCVFICRAINGKPPYSSYPIVRFHNFCTFKHQ